MNSYYNKMIQDDMYNIFKSGFDYNMLNNKTIFITGATGMLATYMVYFLIYLNENVSNFSCKMILSIRNNKKAKDRFGDYLEKEYIKIYSNDICEEIEIKEKIDYIIHAASIAVTQYFKKYPIDVILPNTIGTYRLLELADKNNVDGFLYFSTVSIYGKILKNKPITEETYGILDPLDVGGCYNESKRAGEALCKAYYNQRNVKTKIVRISHTYGPTLELENDPRVFSEFIRNIVEKQNIIMKSKGEEVRSFCYISDATEAFFRILLYGENGEAYNMSNPLARISILELANKLYDMYKDRGTRLISKKRDDDYVENKFSNDLYFSIEKLMKLNWKPKIDIKEGFLRTIKSFEINNNKDGDKN